MAFNVEEFAYWLSDNLGEDYLDKYDDNQLRKQKKIFMKEQKQSFNKYNAPDLFKQLNQIFEKQELTESLSVLKELSRTYNQEKETIDRELTLISKAIEKAKGD